MTHRAINFSLEEVGRTGALNTYTSLAVFLLGAIALVIPSGYSVGAAMLLLGSLVLLAKRPGLTLDRQEWAIIAVLLAYAAVSMLEVWWDGQSSRGLDKPSRFLFAIPALLLLLAYPPRAAFIWGGLATGGLATGLWAVWQKFALDMERALGYTSTIQFGNLSMLLGILCLAGLGWACLQPRARLWMVLLLAGAGFGILGSLLSSSRGGWVGFPFVLWVLYSGYGQSLPRRALAGLAAFIIVGSVAVYAIPQLGVQHRVHQAFSDIENFVEHDKVTTSVGWRLEMWRTAAILISEQPVLGWGSLGYEQARDRLIEEGVIHSSLVRFGHVHNEYLDAWLKRGVPGLVVLLALYLVPLRLFARRMREKDLQLRAFAIAGVLLPVAYMDFGLTQVFLAHNSGVMMYAFWLVVLWAAMRNREKAITVTATRPGRLLEFK